MIKTLLRLEALILLSVFILIYNVQDYSWLLFGLLFFVPDIFALGYIKNTKLGSISYNLGHSYVIPFAILITGHLMQSDTIYSIAFIWFAHIAMDRSLGFGLKHKTDFKHTHLGRIGK